MLICMSGKHAKRFQKSNIDRLDALERRERQPAAPLLEILRPRAGQVVVDLGAGTGYFAIPMAHMVRTDDGGGRVIAVDAEPRMLEVLGERAAGAGVAEAIVPVAVSGADTERLPVEDGGADLILAVNLVHELDERSRAFDECRRIVAPDGRLAVVDWDPEAAMDWGPPADHRLAAGEVEEELRSAGFEAVSRLRVYESHYVLVARPHGTAG